MNEIEQFKSRGFLGRNGRLLVEWEDIDKQYGNHCDIFYQILKRNSEGLPVKYEIVYNIHSFCGVEDPDNNGLRHPKFADQFVMHINIPNNYPGIDAKLEFKFQVKDALGEGRPHPWHPNIHFHGDVDIAGRVCLNTDACGTYTSLAWYIERVAQYLRYETYHAKIGVPPYPEDDKVAEWVTEQGVPNGWIRKLQQFHKNHKG